MPGDSLINSSDIFLFLQFDSHFRIWLAFEIERLVSLNFAIIWEVDHTHALSVVLVATPMVSIPVLVHRAVLIALDAFPLRWVVDVVIVVQVAHDVVPIEFLACKTKFHTEVFNFVFR